MSSVVAIHVALNRLFTCINTFQQEYSSWVKKIQQRFLLIEKYEIFSGFPTFFFQSTQV